MSPYASPPPFLFDTTSPSSFFANNIHEVDTQLPPLAFADAYNLPFFSFETPLPPLDPVTADGANGGGGRRKRRRGQRSDWHSKIRTTQGLRDRRVRLSVDIAGRFFALQDMLGFEKASATIDWLLEQSKPAIERAAAVRASVLSSALLVRVPSCRSSPKSAELSDSLQTSDNLVAKGLQPSSPMLSAVHSTISRRESRAEAPARWRTIDRKKKKMLLEAEDGGITGQFDSTEHLLRHSIDEVPSLVGSDLRTSLVVDNTKELYDFECLPISVYGESSPLCMFGHPQSEDYSLIFDDAGASHGLLPRGLHHWELPS
ncbi:transcription factor TCP12-like [Iris pallida]|uniref:Transcription factor TCP12-like n=1 Tax=Iris pallida TaxID=29817 RepID=A0AAX6DUF7_IRIPA|nr:transcription factor TCP12-like [Iris pallida]KAJ6822216.1 transcription factor TCP12-like [Iris pallida]